MRIASSSAIRSFSYDEETRELTITFTSGKTYRYSDVPEWVHDELSTAPSHGEYFNHRIKDRYPFTPVRKP